MEPSTSRIKEDSSDFKSRVSHWIFKHFVKDYNQEDRHIIYEKTVDTRLCQSSCDSKKQTLQGDGTADQVSRTTETNIHSCNDKVSADSPTQISSKPGEISIENFFNVLKSRTVAELGDHEQSCRLHWSRQSFCHRTGSKDIATPSGRDKDFKCTCAQQAECKSVAYEINPSPPSDEDCEGEPSDACLKTDTGKKQLEGDVNGKTRGGKKGKWWRHTHLKKPLTPEFTETTKQDTKFEKRDLMQQIRTESEIEVKGLCCNDGNVRQSNHEVATTSDAPTQNTPKAIKQNVLKSRIPRPISRTRDCDRKTSQMTRKPQIVDDLFISKITIYDELKFLRRDLALGWLTKHEARERIQDVKHRFNVNLCSYLTNHEFQQIFGDNDDESELEEESNHNILGSWEKSTNV